MSMSKLRRFGRKSERGFALAMSLLLLVLAVLIVTAYASTLQSAFGSSATDSYQFAATSAAMAGVYKAAGYIINDSNAVLLDGAIPDAAVNGDSKWYQMAGDSFVALGPGLYFRVRVYDEAGKVNMNDIKGPRASVTDSCIVSLLRETKFTQWTSGNALSIGDAYTVADNCKNNPPGATTDSTYLFTPTQIYSYVSSSNTCKYIPYLTCYGYNQTDSSKININMAESPVLRAGMIQALSPSLSMTACQTVADKVYNYLTNSTSNTLMDDTCFYKLSDVTSFKITTLTATESAAITTNYDRLRGVFRVYSSNYFTIAATGFKFKANVDPAVDTPLARAVILAVIRRTGNGTASKGAIVYWREIYEDDLTRYAFGTPRYPKFPWDPYLYK